MPGEVDNLLYQFVSMGKNRKILTQYDHQIGYWVSGKKGIGKFEPLTTFGLRLLKHVQAPNEAGFVVEVSHRKRNDKRETEVCKG